MIDMYADSVVSEIVGLQVTVRGGISQIFKDIEYPGLNIKGCIVLSVCFVGGEITNSVNPITGKYIFISDLHTITSVSGFLDYN